MLTKTAIDLILDWRTWAAMAVIAMLPTSALRVVARIYPRGDERRDELLGEIHAVPFWYRPIWVLQQLEVVLWEGVPERLYMLAAGRVIERWTLRSGVEANRRSPKTFEIPSDEERHNLRPGDVVKLMFYLRNGEWGERMWVTVDRPRRNGYVGRLSNTPVGIPRLDSGDTVKFRAEHVIDIDDDPENVFGRSCTCPQPLTDCDRIDLRRCAKCGLTFYTQPRPQS